MPVFAAFVRLQLCSGLHEKFVAGVFAARGLLNGDQFGHFLVATELHEQLASMSVLTTITHYRYNYQGPTVTSHLVEVLLGQVHPLP